MVYAPTIITMTLNEYLMVRENAALLKVHRRFLNKEARSFSSKITPFRFLFYFIFQRNRYSIDNHCDISVIIITTVNNNNNKTTIQQNNKTTTTLECSLKQL